MLNTMLRQIAHRTILVPPHVRHCSQTIYESLLGCCRMWEATGDAVWRERAERVLDILRRIQRPDGGFDIGYDFNFGRQHRKGDATSPELVGLVAYCQFARLFGDDSVAVPARRAADWIRRHSLDMGGRRIAIPYSPHTVKEVMVYNGTSFASGALGCFLGQFGGRDEERRLYRGMVEYLDDVLDRDPSFPGRFWYYCDQSRTDLTELQRRKVDYYHQMQQVEMHALAQQACPHELQLSMIRDAADHVIAVRQKNPILPYTNCTQLFKGEIHLWGLSSVISALLEAAVLVQDRSRVYTEVACEIRDWILAHGWNGESFEAILDNNGQRTEPRRYMVRSDAWVFNAMAAVSKHIGPGPWSDIAAKCFEKMESVDFSGPESHAASKSGRIAIAVWQRFQQGWQAVCPGEGGHPSNFELRGEKL